MRKTGETWGGGRPRPCAGPRLGPNRPREVGEGRTARQPGQVRKEAALTRQGGSLSSLPPSPAPFAINDLSLSARAATAARHIPRGASHGCVPTPLLAAGEGA